MIDDTPPASDRAFDLPAGSLLPRYRDAESGAEAPILQRSAPRAIEWTAERIAGGGVVAIPTDTVYGIAASLAYPDALERIFAIKGRDQSQPLPVLVSSTAVLKRLSPGLDPKVAILLDTFWPGPLTVAIPATRAMPPQVLGPGQTIGVRLPNHPLAIEVIDKSGGTVACTSANRSGEEPARTAQEVAASLGVDLDLILDGGVAPGGVPSTVISLEESQIRVLREGALSEDEVCGAWEQILAGA
jgi:L-threonylcarbamoyladenylate synthase